MCVLVHNTNLNHIWHMVYHCTIVWNSVARSSIKKNNLMRPFKTYPHYNNMMMMIVLLDGWFLWTHECYIYIYILYSIEIAFSYVQSQVHMIFIEETCFQFYISNLYGWFFARLRPLQPKTHMIFVNVQQCRSYINVYTLHITYTLVFFFWPST